MALVSSLAQLQAEVSCPICLDYLRGEVTTESGHNFCHSHIQQCLEDLQDIFPCPVCLQPCPDKSFRMNSQSCLMIDVVKNLPSTGDMRKWQKEKPLCEKHKQVLSLFCEKDLELLCPQRKLKSYIQPLKKQLEDAEKVLEMQVSESFELVWKVENQRSELHSKVEHFKRFWGMEHDEIHVKLLNEENDVETVHHSLIISQDRKIATFQRMEPHCVHNPEAFTSHPSPVLRDLMLAGYELGRSVALNKQILCLFHLQSGQGLSAMIQGTANAWWFQVWDYEEGGGGGHAGSVL
ncbi:PREDICTED: putative tripartite motif-containing protein 75-like [Lipotes vexillifer]|uniref:Tripartite motif-containing protein 75-like n=1 Tax=Lipotes vexillifer TaxID=118797 RepID=A0A340YH96_LIPVE|nr:PREDICTED: putative tripartite motif-containing protein 75-like [Lipotes vexillifer]